jgi:regulatory protein
MGTITRLQVQKGNAERVNVFVDDEFAFAVSLSRAQTLAKGQLLSPQELESLKAEGDQDLAYQRSVRYLARRPRSRQEMADYLARRGHDEATVDAVLEQLEARRYVDDHAFAEFWVEQRNRFRPRGERALRHELRQKGIERAVVDETLEEQDEEAAAWAALEPKLSRGFGDDKAVFFQKALAHLARRGFGYATARRAVERAWAQVEASETAAGDGDDLDDDGLFDHEA